MSLTFCTAAVHCQNCDNTNTINNHSSCLLSTFGVVTCCFTKVDCPERALLDRGRCFFGVCCNPQGRRTEESFHHGSALGAQLPGACTGEKWLTSSPAVCCCHPCKVLLAVQCFSCKTGLCVTFLASGVKNHPANIFSHC